MIYSWPQQEARAGGEGIALEFRFFALIQLDYVFWIEGVAHSKA
jgi:hypothetical protein